MRVDCIPYAMSLVSSLSCLVLVVSLLMVSLFALSNRSLAHAGHTTPRTHGASFPALICKISSNITAFSVIVRRFLYSFLAYNFSQFLLYFSSTFPLSSFRSTAVARLEFQVSPCLLGKRKQAARKAELRANFDRMYYS